MKSTKLCLLATALVLFTSTVFAQTQHITVSAPFYKMTLTLSDEAVTPNISQPTAEINNGAQGAEAIMNSLITKVGGNNLTALALEEEAFKDKDFYCVFHILRWTDPVANVKQTVQAQRWYLYHQGTLTLGSPTQVPRLYGVGAVTFIYIHLNKALPTAL